MTQVLQPLLVAWAQLGDGRPDSALSTLQPYVEDPRFRTLFVANAAMIADLGNRPDDAGKLYHALETGMAEPNLRLSQILASWQARTGQSVDAQRTLASLSSVATDMSIAMPALLSNATKRVVAKPSDGIAETYFTFAAMLRAQDMNDFSLIMLRMALDLRPDFTAARLLIADIMTSQRHPAMALAMLNEVPASDPIYPVVELRRATLLNNLGRSDEAMRDAAATVGRLSVQPAAGSRSAATSYAPRSNSRSGLGLRQGDRPHLGPVAVRLGAVLQPWRGRGSGAPVAQSRSGSAHVRWNYRRTSHLC